MKKLLILLLGSGFISCGDSNDNGGNYQQPQQQPAPLPQPVPQPNGGGSGGGAQRLSYQAMDQLLDTYCAQCHGGDDFLQSEEGLRRSTTRARLIDESMPPRNAARRLGVRERTAMVNFFN